MDLRKIGLNVKSIEVYSKCVQFSLSHAGVVEYFMDIKE